MTAFINEHKDGLKAAIRRVCPNIGVLTNREIRLWIANDEGLIRVWIILWKTLKS